MSSFIRNLAKTRAVILSSPLGEYRRMKPTISVILSDAPALYRRMKPATTLRYAQHLLSKKMQEAKKVAAALLSVTTAVGVTGTLNPVILSSPLGEYRRMSDAPALYRRIIFSIALRYKTPFFYSALQLFYYLR
jgi:hypothetical protein